MKGISGNPTLDAYSRMSVGAVKKTGAATPVKATTQVERQPTQAAKVSISSKARDMAATSAADSQINTSKVDGIKAQMAAGTLKFDATTVASNMVDSLG